MNCQNVFCSGWTILHSHQCIRVPIFPHPCLNWLSKVVEWLNWDGVLKDKALSSHPYSSLSSRFLNTCVNHGHSWPYSVHTSMALPHTGTKVNAWLWVGLGKSWRRWWQDRRLPCNGISLSISSTAPSQYPCPGTLSLATCSLFRQHFFFCKQLWLIFYKFSIQRVL